MDYFSCSAQERFNGEAKNQYVVAKSTVESEYVAIYFAAKEEIWLRAMITECGLEHTKPIGIFI